MWILSYRFCSSGIFLLMLTLAGSVDVDVSKSKSFPSNSIVDGSIKIFTDSFNDEEKLYPVSSDGADRRNRYSIVNEQWNAEKSNGSVGLNGQQANKSSTNNIGGSPSAASAGDLNVFLPYFYTGCTWLPINHVTFQMAHVFLCLSYLAPPTLYGLIYLRLVLAIGSAFLAGWACFIICAFDTFIWNSLFLLINAVHAILLIFSLRTVKFGPQIEQVYQHFFEPLKVSKHQFKKVAKCIKSIRLLARGEYFAVEKEAKVETLSLLLSGSMLTIENSRTLHYLHPMQFLDSAEWFDVSPDDCYHQTSIQACEESRILLWHRDQLLSILQKDLFLQSVFRQILGRDVVGKLCLMRQRIASSSCGGSPLFKTNLLNNVLFVESEKPAVTTTLSPTSNPKNVKVKFSKRIRKPIQQIKENKTFNPNSGANIPAHISTSNPMNTL